MTRKIPIALMLPSLTLLAAPLHAVEVVAQAAPAATPAAEPSAAETPTAGETPAGEAAEAEAAAEDAVTTLAVITPRLFLFDYFDGVGEDKTHFLERYDYREAFGGDTRSGVFADLDLDLTVNDGERDKFVLERRGFGEHNHRGTAKYGNDKLGVYGSYSHYRSATGGIDYLFSPGQVAGGTVQGSGPFSTFSDTSGTSNYHIDRTTWGAGFKLKPTVLADMATVAVDYQGYQRDGNKFAPFLLDFGSAITGQERWRGVNMNVDERMNRVGLTLSASPRKRFEVAYEVSFEEFTNKAPELQLQRDILGTAPNPTAALLYVPDSQLVNHAIRASKNFGDRMVVAAGYGASWLKQDSFSELEFTSGHTKGRIANDNAYLTANALVSPKVSLEGHVKYHDRDNDSSFGDALINLNTLVAPRIDRINSLDYGIAAGWRPGWLGSNLTLGWRRLDKERDLSFGAATGAGRAILPPQTLYREDTESDEIYLKWTARPATGWNLRVTPSFTWADKTGLVTEPEEAFRLKSMLTYAAPAGWVVSGFYDYTDKQNGNNTFTDGDGVLTYKQDIDSTLHTAGLSLNGTPREDVNAYTSLYWMQNDLSSYLFTTNTLRWTGNVTFDLVDQPNYQVDSWVFSVGADWEASEKLKLDASYTFTKSSGDVASGTVLASLVTATGTIDSVIDNTLHSFALGADYVLNDKATLRVNYFYDRYEDDAYDLLSGGVNVLAVGVAFAL